MVRFHLRDIRLFRRIVDDGCGTAGNVQFNCKLLHIFAPSIIDVGTFDLNLLFIKYSLFNYRYNKKNNIVPRQNYFHFRVIYRCVSARPQRTTFYIQNFTLAKKVIEKNIIRIYSSIICYERVGDCSEQALRGKKLPQLQMNLCYSVLQKIHNASLNK